ncbi:uncharacterized protein LOC143037781 [Oratosquilla oratoria]|uniref:uncharacterized protein LOC143037781 n=1 Tax=Oratosquilla oratoria TaxID=337810 RepID=UPI003F7735EA
MKPGDSTIPKFYGLPKVHKEGVPLRPIIAFRSSPTYNLARDLAKRLRPLVESSERMLSNSTDFVERLRGVNLGEDDCLVSFDVKAMFTSLPQGLIRQAAMSTVESSPEFLDKSKLTAKELMGLVDLCLDSTFFKFRDKIYHQKVGTPMVSPISVVLAEIAMQRYEEEVLKDAPPSLKLWVRYVDNVFVIMKKEEVEPFFERLNTKNEANQFEMEKEENGRLPFLDVMVTRSGSTLTTGVYRKDIHTDRLRDYGSCHPATHKRTHKPKNTLHRALTKIKDTVSQADRMGVVYDIGCKDCETHYVGETSKKLATRLLEHQRAVGRRDMSSAILRHTEETGHEMDWQNAEVKYGDPYRPVIRAKYHSRRFETAVLGIGERNRDSKQQEYHSKCFSESN